MNKGFFLLFIFSFFLIAIHSQHAADKWYFGNKSAIDFSTGSPISISTSMMEAGEGSASISDPLTGELLFYTDGISVWNSDNSVMPNGTGLAGGLSSTQAALIVPKPESPSEYYIFTTDQIGGSLGLRYSIVNMNLESGSGNVTIKNTLLKTPVTEKLTAVQDPGTPNFWVLSHGWNNNAFYAFKVSATGIDSAVISNVGIVHNNNTIENSYGQMKFNPCGDKVALAAGYLNTVEVFDFDIITGEVSNPKTILYSDHVYGLEFSPNSDVLYVSTYQSNANLIQYDLTINDLTAMVSAAEIVSITPYIYPLQRGPNGKIYVCRSFDQYLGVIHSPNMVGSVACNYIEMGFDLDPAMLGSNSALGLPNFVTSFTGETDFCIGSTNALKETDNDLISLISPNPSENEFTLSTKDDISQIQILDISGNEVEVFKTISKGMTIKFGENYSEGVYIVRMSTMKGDSTLRILKVK